MTQEEIIDSVMANAVIADLAVSDDLKRKRVAKLVMSALDECMMRFDWSFTTSVHSHVGGSVSGTPLYTLTGASSDCRSLISIRYGEKLTRLPMLRPADFDTKYSGKELPTDVVEWVPEGTVNKFPQIRLIGTPDESGLEIRYRYRRNNLSIADWPSEGGYVIESCIIKKMVPTLETRQAFTEDIKSLIAKFERGGDDIDKVPLDPYQLARINELNSLHGY